MPGGEAIDYAAANSEERERLRAFLDRLTDEQLTQPIGGGWTPVVALGHLAFWDRRAAFVLDRWSEGTPPPDDEPDWLEDMLNKILVDEWAALPPTAAATLALDAANAVDSRIAALEQAIVDSAVTSGEGWLVARFRHRREHLDQIEGGLGPSRR